MNRTYQASRPTHRLFAAVCAVVVTASVALWIDALARSYGGPVLAAAPAATRTA